MTLCLKKTYLGDKEVSKYTKEVGRTALEKAKARAHGQTANMAPTLQVQIVVGGGEGRTKRELN